MQVTIRLAPNRDQAGGDSSDDLVLDLFASGAKHFDPIDDDEDEELDELEPPRPTASETKVSQEPVVSPPEPVKPLVTASAERRDVPASRGGKLPVPPADSKKKKSTASHWESLAASLGLETPSPSTPDAEVSSQTSPTKTGDEISLGDPLAKRGADASRANVDRADVDSWKMSVAELFQIDPAEVPDRASSTVDAEQADGDEVETEFVSDLDADFVEFEVRDLTPAQPRPSSSQAAGRSSGERVPRRDRGEERSREGDRRRSVDREARSVRRDSIESRERAESRRDAIQPDIAETGSPRSAKPPRPSHTRAAKSASAAPASDKLIHERDEVIDDPHGEPSKRVTSWAEAIDVIIDKNLANRRRSGTSSSRRPRNDRNR